MSVVPLRALLPEPGRVLLAALVVAAILFMSLQLQSLQRDEMEWFRSIAWMIGGFLWWILIAARSACLAYGVLSMRLPGAARVLGAGAGINLLLCVVLPLLVLRLTCADANLGLLGGALFLGCAFGALMLALPGHPWMPALVPLVFLLVNYYPIWWPATAWQYWGVSLVMLGLVAALWAWLCTSARGWQPLAIHMDLPVTTAMQQPKRQFSDGLRVKSEPKCASPTQRLVEVFGPELKGLSQMSSWRNRLLGGLFMLTCLGLIVWLEPDRGNRLLVRYGVVVVCMLLVTNPARYLLKMQTSNNQGQLAELLLLPGLSRQWLQVLCAQILRVMAERLAVLGLMFVLVAWDYGFPVVWLQWFGLCLLVLLPYGLLRALLIVGQSRQPRYWLLIDFVLLGLGIASSHLLFRADGSVAIWLMPLWLALGLVFTGLAAIAYQRLQRHGSPFFS